MAIRDFGKIKSGVLHANNWIDIEDKNNDNYFLISTLKVNDNRVRYYYKFITCNRDIQVGNSSTNVKYIPLEGTGWEIDPT